MIDNYTDYYVPKDIDIKSMSQEQKLYALNLKNLCNLTKKFELLKPVVESYTQETTKKLKKKYGIADENELSIKQKYELKRIINKYPEVEKYNRVCEEINDIKTALWGKIMLFARSLVNDMSRKYKKPSDYEADLMQECATQFTKALPRYNPFRHTPSTFFKYHFLEVISNYLRNDSQHLTQNDANNLGLVRKAMRQFEQEGVEPDLEMLSQATGLSVKVVKKTLFYGMNSQYADVDEAYTLSDNKHNPEDVFFENERKRNLQEALSSLSEEEREFTFYFMDMDNSNGGKQRNYRQVAEHFHMQQSEVKSMWSHICSKLSGHASLKDYSKKKSETPQISLFDENISVEVEEELKIIFNKKKKL